MFRLSSCCGEKSTLVISLQSADSRQTPAPAAEDRKDKGTLWWYRLFGRPVTRSPKRAQWWPQVRKNQVTPAPEHEEQSNSTTHHDEVVELEDFTTEDEEQLEEKEEVSQCKSQDTPDKDTTTTKTTRQQHIRFLGLPNPAQICYLNSSLQSLLTLQDFARDFSNQEEIWGLTQETEVIRSFTDIRGAHFSSDAQHKLRLLEKFKRAVSVWAPEFADLHQKDAHEFLTAVLEQMRTLGLQLQITAASMDRVFRCPVEGHMVFKMANTRTCKKCGGGSTRVEQFTNLSLDLVPGGGTVDELLQDYLRDKNLEYKCDCGANTSSMSSSFVSLPRVLILHLKRFKFSPTWQLTKIHDPVDLLRDVVVPSKEGGSCFSLVSTISHIGYTATSGHYISDGVDPDVDQEDPTDRWFSFNDAQVTEASGDWVCNQRRTTAYILFYQRQD